MSSYLVSSYLMKRMNLALKVAAVFGLVAAAQSGFAATLIEHADGSVTAGFSAKVKELF